MSFRINLHFLLWNVGLAKAETQTTEAERECIVKHATGKSRLAEIGVWHGVTTSRIRRVMCPDGTLFAVDPFPKGKLGFSVQRVIAQGEVNRISNGNVIFLRMKGTDAASSLSGEQLLEFVFIDGDHSYEGLRLDWTDWSKLLSDDGVIALHDSRSTAARPIDGAGSVRFTEEVILNDPGFEVIEAVESLTVLKRARPSQG